MPESVAQVIAGASAILLSTLVTWSARRVYTWGRTVERILRALHKGAERDVRILRELTSIRRDISELRSEVTHSRPVRRQDHGE